MLIAQTIAQLRSDALAEGNLVGSLNALLNGEKKPSWMGPVRITEVGLGEEFPIFSNCRVWPVEADDEEATGAGAGAAGGGGGRLQARMDVDLSDSLTLGIETTMVLNYPRPRIAVLPVALSVSVVRFSGTLSISFLPASSAPVPDSTTIASNSATAPILPMLPPPAPGKRTPTTLSFSFSPSYTLSLSTRSLLGSKSRLQDIPKIAQIIEAQLRGWFEERCVSPRTQRIVVPSLWPRMKNVVKEGGKSAVAEDSGSEGERDLREEARRELEEGQQRRKEREDVGREWDGLRRRGFGLGTGEDARATAAMGMARASVEKRAGNTNGRVSTHMPGENSNVAGGRAEVEWHMPGPMPGTLVS